MTVSEIMTQLEEFGNPQTKKTLMKHGAVEPLFGVKVGDLKKIQKKVKKDHKLSLALYDTGNSDAMYLAGLIADEKQITKEQLQHWVRKANWYMLSEYTVAWIAAESAYGFELAREWITSTEPHVAAAGWSTWGSLVTIKADEELDLQELSKLLKQVEKDIHKAPNRVRYVMNNFVIAVGGAVAGLTDQATKVATAVGKVQVEMGGTACKVPDAAAYIQKMEKSGRIGKKKKMARC
jgi:3-methyladenine DNA glycosylase AlkD